MFDWLLTHPIERCKSIFEEGSWQHMSNCIKDILVKWDEDKSAKYILKLKSGFIPFLARFQWLLKYSDNAVEKVRVKWWGKRFNSWPFMNFVAITKKHHVSVFKVSNITVFNDFQCLNLSSSRWYNSNYDGL